MLKIVAFLQAEAEPVVIDLPADDSSGSGGDDIDDKDRKQRKQAPVLRPQAKVRPRGSSEPNQDSMTHVDGQSFSTCSRCQRL